jgi:hypothetical protein
MPTSLAAAGLRFWRRSDTACRCPIPADIAPLPVRCEAGAVSDVHTVVLVEGASDSSAVEALAARRGRDLAAEGISLVAMGGATNIGAYIGRFGPPGRDLRLAGLCDAGEEGGFRRVLERAGLGSGLGRGDL